MDIDRLIHVSVTDHRVIRLTVRGRLCAADLPAMRFDISKASAIILVSRDGDTRKREAADLMALCPDEEKLVWRKTAKTGMIAESAACRWG